MRVRYWLGRTGYQFGWIVRYTGSFGDEAEIVTDSGSRIYLSCGAVECYERLWMR